MNTFSHTLKNRLQKETPRWFVCLVDVCLTLLSFILALAIVWQSEWQIGFKDSSQTMVIGNLIYIITFLIFRPYKGLVQFTGIEDIIKILQATFLAFLINIVGLFLIESSYSNQNLILVVLHFLISSNILVFSRILYKHLYAVLMQSNLGGKNFLIYGAGLSGIFTYIALQADASVENRVVAFVDDNPKLQGNRIKGLNVISPKQITSEWFAKKKIDEVIISIQNIGIEELNNIVNKFEGLSVKVRLVPLLIDWIDGNLEATQIQEIHINDLLGRNPIDIKKDAIRKEVKGKVVLVTGAAGSVGCEISSQLLKHACKKLILVDQAESDLKKLEESCLSLKIMKGVEVEFINADIRDDFVVDSIYNRFRPDIVYHADAYNKVYDRSEDTNEAITVNIKATQHLLSGANRYGVEKLVMVSIE